MTWLLEHCWFIYIYFSRQDHKKCVWIILLILRLCAFFQLYSRSCLWNRFMKKEMQWWWVLAFCFAYYVFLYYIFFFWRSVTKPTTASYDLCTNTTIYIVTRVECFSGRHGRQGFYSVVTSKYFVLVSELCNLSCFDTVRTNTSCFWICSVIFVSKRPVSSASGLKAARSSCPS